MTRVTVFFYGLFMDPVLLRGQGIEPENPRAATVAAYRLAIGKRAAMLPDPRGSVWGVAYDLTHEEIDRLYGDATLTAYREAAVIAVPVAGPPFAALIYTLSPEEVGAPPNADYARRLADILTQLDAPEAAVTLAKQFV